MGIAIIIFLSLITLLLAMIWDKLNEIKDKI